MAWHKQQEYDPTEAFVQNARQQKMLELKLEEIDKLWYMELKNLAKERLDTTNELKRLEDTKRSLQYYDSKITVSDLKRYTDGVVEQFRRLNRENTKDNFNFETSAMKIKRLSVSLPTLNQVGFAAIPRRTKIHKKKSKDKNRKHSVSKSSTLKGTRLKSISDSNLHTSEKYKESRAISNSADVRTGRIKKSGVEFPPIDNSKLGSAKSDDHRYLKQKMATTLELPPVIEVNSCRNRKMSI